MFHHHPLRPAVCVALTLALLGCNSGNPVVPTDPGGPGSGDQLTITITSDRNRLDAGSPVAATLTITAKKKDGSAAANGTQVSVNTNLGSFGTGDDGMPIRLVTRQLTGGVATVSFFAGSDVGTANILAQIGTNTGRLSMPIVQPAPGPGAPTAAFTFEVRGVTVIFTDASTNAVSWLWEFGDGATSTERNPTHTYPNAGTWPAKLTVANSASQQASATKFVDLAPPPVADFQTSIAGPRVLFTDKSTGSPTAWRWDFGDCSDNRLNCTDTRQNPDHTYLKAGTYEVQLTVTNAVGTGQKKAFVSVTAGDPPTANFNVTVSGLTANFVDRSTGNPTAWEWDFGDGTTSAAQNPSHDYARPGTYSVRLKASNAGGASVVAQAVTVAVLPVAEFEFAVNGLHAAFIDRSTGSPTEWAWTFGDCPSCPPTTAQSPAHDYAAAGTYTVTLKATNAAGSSTASKFVSVAATPVAKFTYTVNGTTVLFTDLSTGNPTRWFWEFGDQASSTEQNPVHEYPNDAVRTYTVTLTVSNAGGQSVARQFVSITPPP